ncbi:MAG: Ig-like domain-containing protein [Nitrospirota bacterium]
MTMNRWIRMLGVGSLCLLSACGDGSSDAPLSAPPSQPPEPTPVSPPPPSALPFKVMPPRVSLAVDGQGALAAIGAISTVTWTSSDPTVAWVDANGVVMAVARGSATITATDGTRSSSATVKVWQTAGPNPDASTESLIAAALAAGRISAEEALVYRVYVMFGDERLPTEYDGAPDPQAGVSLRLLSEQLPTLSQATQDILRPFFIPPIYPESWFGRQLGLATAEAVQAAQTVQTVQAVQAGSPTLCSAEVVTAFIQAGLLVRRTTAHYNLYASVSQFGNEDALLDYGASVIEQIDAALTGLLQRHAQSDAAEACNGGDGAVDIYLTDGLLAAEFGATVAYPDRCENTPAYILLNKLPLSIAFNADKALSQRWLRTVLTHEVTHTIQFGMDRAAACADYDWIDEGTAQWAPDHVFPADNEEDGFKKLSTTHRSGDYFINYLKGGHRESIEKTNGYSTYIYFQFIARKYGAAAVKALFDVWASSGSVDSLDAALKAVGGNLRDAWPEFGKALWNDVRDNVLTDLRGWDGYDYGMANVAQANPTTLAGGRTTLALLSANGGKLAPRSLAYERLTFPDEVSPVLLSNPLGLLPQAQHLKLTALKKIGGQWRTPEDWTADADKYFCRDKVGERLEELVLIVSNSDPDPNAAPVTLPTNTPFELSASNVGCWKWQGSATRQIISDDGVQSSEYTARGTDLVFEPQGDTAAGGVLFLAPIAGSANGLSTLRSTIPPCTTTITGPTTTVSATDGALIFNLDLKTSAATPDRRVGTLVGTTFIDSTQVATCNGQTTTTPAPGTGWQWLLYPVTTNPLDVSPDGKTIAANFTQTATNTRTVHNFSYTAMRE